MSGESIHEEKSLTAERPSSVAGGESTVKPRNKTAELVQIAVYALVFAYIIRVFFVQAFKIPTGSMEDTLWVGDLLLVNKLVYGAKTPETVPFTSIRLPQYRLPALRHPQPGDVLVFKFPPDPSVDYIKRCIAIAGQTVEIRDKEVFVDGRSFSEISNPQGLKFEDPEVIPKNKGYDAVYPRGAGSRDNYGPVTVPEGQLFVMGDNRDRSYDSRQWGFVPLDYVLGKAMLVYWSSAGNDFWSPRWSRIGLIVE